VNIRSNGSDYYWLRPPAHVQKKRFYSCLLAHPTKHIRK
jgi:hypothetical protein